MLGCERDDRELPGCGRGGILFANNISSVAEMRMIANDPGVVSPCGQSSHRSIVSWPKYRSQFGHTTLIRELRPRFEGRTAILFLFLFTANLPPVAELRMRTARVWT
uniref:(northern house mosquito) hypothetical protein n=1 Tax=Culex pipiens TaxID=7175 RepID=A0A8D8NU44_CULPI